MYHNAPPLKIKGYRNCTIKDSTNNSFVYVARKFNTNRDQVILKYIPHDEQAIEQIDFECNIQKFLHNNYVMPLHNFFDIPEGFRVLEMPVAFKSLHELDSLKNISQIYKIMYQLALGVEYLHSENVLHGDLKPKNAVLMNNDEENPLVHIIDFGFAKKFSNANKNNCFCRCNKATQGFSAPEIIKKEPHSFPADIWSLGATYYYLITGKFIKRSFYGEQIEFLNYDSNFGGELLESGKKLINKMISDNPNERPTAKMIVNCEFFKQALGNYLTKLQDNSNNLDIGNSSNLMQK